MKLVILRVKMLYGSSRVDLAAKSLRVTKRT